MTLCQSTCVTRYPEYLLHPPDGKLTCCRLCPALQRGKRERCPQQGRHHPAYSSLLPHAKSNDFPMTPAGIGDETKHLKIVFRRAGHGDYLDDISARLYTFVEK